MAHGGTLFLDEVGEMSLRMQALLLRFLETGEIQSVGAHDEMHHVDVRVIAATNRNLPERVAAGEFREDLLYRLRVIHIHVPPLRERRDDIPLLVAHLLKRTERTMEVSEDAMILLQRYRWPGNIRELQNVVEQAMWFADREIIDVGHLPPSVRSSGEGLLPQRERRRQTADDLYDALVSGGYSFWEHIHPIFLSRDITRHDIRELVIRGLRTTNGNYRGAAAAVRDPDAGLQALSQLPDGARMQGGLPLVPPGHARAGATPQGRAAAPAAGIKRTEPVRSGREPGRRRRAHRPLILTGQARQLPNFQLTRPRRRSYAPP